MHERIKQQQDQLQKQRENRGKQLQDNRNRKEATSKQTSGKKHDMFPSSPNLNLNHEQEMKLVELKKQRESLKKPQNNGSKIMHNEPSAIDEMPMEELLGTDPEPRRLGKRPRLDCNTDLSTEVRQKLFVNVHNIHCDNFGGCSGFLILLIFIQSMLCLLGKRYPKITSCLGGREDNHVYNFLFRAI